MSGTKAPEAPTVRLAPVPFEVVEALAWAREACAGWEKVPPGVQWGEPLTAGDRSGLACDMVQDPAHARDAHFYSGAATSLSAFLLAWLALRAARAGYGAVRRSFGRPRRPTAEARR